MSAHPADTVTNMAQSNRRLINKLYFYLKIPATFPRHSPASAAEAASWTGTAVRSFEAEPGAFAPGDLEDPGAQRAAYGVAKGTWRSLARRSSPQALLVAAAYL